MKSRTGKRKTFAALATAAGFFLLFVELQRFRSGDMSQSWFWLLVAGLMIVFGMVELLSAGSRAGKKEHEQE